MAMMTARRCAVREAPWSRAIARARASARGLKKRAAGYQCADGLSAFAARISATIDWTAGDSAMCLARQAGPGPRI